jgi:multidrug resistance efflux pump
MQIPDPKTSQFPTKITLLIFLVIVIAITIVIFTQTNKNEIPISVVKKSTVTNTVALFGRLRAKNERSIIPKVSGTLAEKSIRPGDLVPNKAVLLRLNNIEIEQKLITSEMEVISAEANLKELNSDLIRQQRKLINQQALTKAKMNLSKAELKAKLQLAEKKIISSLDLQQAKIYLQQAEIEWQMAKEELLDFEKLKQARKEVSHAKLKQANAYFQIAKSNYDALEIKSSMAGVIQNLDNNIKIGQWLVAGQNLGSIAQSNDLYAEAKVMASNASEINIGQSVELNIKGKKASGFISHIEPNVIDNQIQILIDLSELPSTARLNIEVTGKVNALDKKALFVSKPDYISQPNRQSLVWKKNISNGEFEKIKVQIGEIVQNKVEIISGLQANDTISLKKL